MGSKQFARTEEQDAGTVFKNPYLGQGRPTALDTVAYHARGLQLMV